MTQTTPEHAEEPAEGADSPPDGGGRTPHPQEPAEGSDEADAARGLDPENRI